MNYRSVVLNARELLGNSGTKIIDINVKDPITMLHVYFDFTTGTNLRIAPEPAVISKLEIVDGSEVLVSLTGEEVVALGFYEGHPNISFAAMNLQTTSIDVHMRLYFGRFFGDPVLALDPTKFRNPQIKITWDCTLVAAGSTALYAQVIAECFDEKVISPVGFLRQTEHNVYTGGVSTYKYIDLPTDLPLRKLYLQTRAWGDALPILLEDVKLSEDNDKRIPFQFEDEYWSQRCFELFGTVHQSVYGLGNIARYIYTCAFDSMLPAIANAITIGDGIRAAKMTGGDFRISATINTDLCVGHMSGFLPYGVLCYPFGDQQDIDDWYDVTRVGSLVWRVKCGTSGATTTYRTILQQLRRY